MRLNYKYLTHIEASKLQHIKFMFMLRYMYFHCQYQHLLSQIPNRRTCGESLP